MEFIRTITSAIGDFFGTYGESFAMMVIAGFIIAFIVELGVKKAFDYLEEKLDGKDKILSVLSVIRMGAIFVVTFVMSIVSTHLILNGGLEIPGNKALAPFWFAIIYGAQYVFSMYGIKGILKLKEEKKSKEPKAPKEPKPKKVNPVEGMEKLAYNVYRASDGVLYNKKGEKI